MHHPLSVQSASDTLFRTPKRDIMVDHLFDHGFE